MSQSKPTIGFIGLGLMGQAFTRCLCRLGYTVVGYDLQDGKITAAAEHGVQAAASAADLTARADLVLICVTSTDGVRAAVFGPGGVVEAANADKLLVDHSTSIVQDTKDMAAELLERTGMGWIDAPVSGGPPAARTGSLAIMAGGADTDIARVAPVMDDLAAQFTHMGPVGAGQVTKMINQVLVLNNYAILAEALAMAEAGGIDAGKIPEALGHLVQGIIKLAGFHARPDHIDVNIVEYAGEIGQGVTEIHAPLDIVRNILNGAAQAPLRRLPRQIVQNIHQLQAAADHG
ncbi:MAG: NAD(P)-dependent oxidoreductase [Alphaproteobacteria bacterium]|jgi:3-hydroxyisobutyrate dehydrogenase-like beta-hydroxyacid dehydrogenase|nr:NAD(P)-dependent oxidoreductase [Alphaproteobacteria bacterium]